MSTYGSITSHIDVAQLTLYGFWLFFAGLIFYLRTEDKREGFPMESETTPGLRPVGFPPIPAPKTFVMRHGPDVRAPRPEPIQTVRARPTESWPGAPLTPTGNPLVDGVGPAAWCERAEVPEMTYDEGLPKIVPLRAAPGYFLAAEDPDPRGMTVVGGDDTPAGVVVDAWVDRSETIIRYLEVDVTAAGGVGRRLVPMPLVRISGSERKVRVRTLMAAQFAEIPALGVADQITMREEDRIVAYVGGGQLYAEPSRLGPIL
jgi:photosynthetic reaction center H subunit